MGSFFACMERRVVMVTFLRWGVLEAIGEWEECLHCCERAMIALDDNDGLRVALANRGRDWRDMVVRGCVWSLSFSFVCVK